MPERTVLTELQSEFLADPRVKEQLTAFSIQRADQTASDFERIEMLVSEQQRLEQNTEELARRIKRVKDAWKCVGGIVIDRKDVQERIELDVRWDPIRGTNAPRGASIKYVPVDSWSLETTNDRMGLAHFSTQDAAIEAAIEYMTTGKIAAATKK